MERTPEELPLHPLTSMCRNEWVAIGFNIATAVTTVAFAITLHFFMAHNRTVEKLAKVKNPYDEVISATFWSTIVFAIAMVGVVVFQIVHRFRSSLKIRRVARRSVASRPLAPKKG